MGKKLTEKDIEEFKVCIENLKRKKKFWQKAGLYINIDPYTTEWYHKIDTLIELYKKCIQKGEISEEEEKEAIELARDILDYENQLAKTDIGFIALMKALGD